MLALRTWYWVKLSRTMWMESGGGAPKGQSGWCFQSVWWDGRWAAKLQSSPWTQTMGKNFHLPSQHLTLLLPPPSSHSPGHPSLWPLASRHCCSHFGRGIDCLSQASCSCFLSHSVLEPPGLQPPPRCFCPCSSSWQPLSSSLFCKRWAVSCLLTVIWLQHVEFYSISFLETVPGFTRQALWKAVILLPRCHPLYSRCFLPYLWDGRYHPKLTGSDLRLLGCMCVGKDPLKPNRMTGAERAEQEDRGYCWREIPGQDTGKGSQGRVQQTLWVEDRWM